MNKSFLTPTLFSVFIPGLGQLLLKHRWRALIIFLDVPFLAFLVSWSLDNYKIGLIPGTEPPASWLWAVWALFWVWNVVDTHQLYKKQAGSAFVGVLLTAIIMYFIAWNVTDVKLDRLITRFNDAQKVAADLVNPDLFNIDVNGERKICGPACLLDFAWGSIRGETKSVPRFSENVGDIFGKVKLTDPPRWMVTFGYAERGKPITVFTPGKLVETIAIGLLATFFSTLFAIPLSFLAAHNIMSKIPGGTAVYYVMRTLLNMVRAVDTVIWGLIVIVWVGLGSFAGVIALTIHSVAALGKLFSEEIEHIDPGPVEAVTATGANLVQVIRYAVIPQIVPPFLAYTLLRWDINMRSATVVGFVAGGGIGFFVVETIRMGAYEVYAAALWAVAVVIILVDYISAKWRENILADKPQAVSTTKSRLRLVIKRITYTILGLALFIFCWETTEIDLADLFEPAPTFWRLVGDFVTVDLSPNVVEVVTRQMLITVFQALLATTFGALLAIPFSFLAAKNLTGRSKLLLWIYYLTRSLFNILRSIEALLYVAIFVFWVGIGAFAGTLALSVTTFALLGKLFSEAIENIDPGPIEAVTATGANRLQMIAYAVFPQIFPPFVSYLIYQWDINIRMATIIGFAGGGGIGLTLSTFFGQLQYHKAGTVVLFIVVVVALMDFASAKLRQKLV